jgi:cytochrome c
MKRLLLALVAAVGTVAITAPAFADEGLAKEKKCTTCHAADKAKVGPSYKDVAKKYAGQKDAEAKLAGVIVKGGKGSFGDTPMPPTAGISEADAKKLATWILGLK